MTRLQLFSDLHMDVSHVKPLALADNVDVVVVPGDTCSGAAKGFAYLRGLVPMSVPLVCVAGNHEHYRRCVPEVLAEARARAGEFNVTFLEDSAALVAGVRFVGATLWTDYCLGGADRQELAMDVARRGMNDHRLVTWQKQPTWMRFGPRQALQTHRASRAFLEAELGAPFAGPTVVVTHHAPHPNSVPARFEGDTLNAAYASDLSALMGDHGPDLWVHGHTHDSFDYRVGRTRVVSNPHGYGNENPEFSPALVLEV